jgi:hypothetical protein
MSCYSVVLIAISVSISASSLVTAAEEWVNPPEDANRLDPGVIALALSESCSARWWALGENTSESVGHLEAIGLWFAHNHLTMPEHSSWEKLENDSWERLREAVDSLPAEARIAFAREGYRVALGHIILGAVAAHKGNRGDARDQLTRAETIRRNISRLISGQYVLEREFDACRRPQLLTALPLAGLTKASPRDAADAALNCRIGLPKPKSFMWSDEAYCRSYQLCVYFRNLHIDELKSRLAEPNLSVQDKIDIGSQADGARDYLSTQSQDLSRSVTDLFDRISELERQVKGAPNERLDRDGLKRITANFLAKKLQEQKPIKFVKGFHEEFGYFDFLALDGNRDGWIDLPEVKGLKARFVHQLSPTTIKNVHDRLAKGDSDLKSNRSGLNLHANPIFRDRVLNSTPRRFVSIANHGNGYHLSLATEEFNRQKDGTNLEFYGSLFPGESLN